MALIPLIKMSERMGIWVSWEICTRKRKKHNLGVFSGDGEIPSSELKIRHQKSVDRFAKANFGKSLGRNSWVCEGHDWTGYQSNWGKSRSKRTGCEVLGIGVGNLDRLAEICQGAYSIRLIIEFNFRSPEDYWKWVCKGFTWV